MEKHWLHKIVYQIYPLSFCDSNGDGVGDIPGIISKLDYLQGLGVEVLWLSPVYRSPNADNGYDIADYYDIDPRYGTLSDMDRLIAECRARDMHIVMDLVVNHSSTECEWFQKSRRREEPYTDYYIWREGRGKHPPNNWTGFFGEGAWEYDPLRGEYYLHLFAKGQPDFNYQNPAVVEEVKRILRFWLDRGVAGFRCDVINILYKQSLKNGFPSPILCGLEHYLGTEGTHRILNEFNREVLSNYDCFTVGESVLVTPKSAKLLTDESRHELDLVFSFEHMDSDSFIVKWFHRRFRPRRLFKALVKWQKALRWNAVYLENHDQGRSVSRFGDTGEYWADSAKALATLLLTLRGTPFIYQGQELGMTNYPFSSIDELRDVESHNINALLTRLGFSERVRLRKLRHASRDNARTPMQWTDEPGAGFTEGTPWLVINPNHERINAKAQVNEPNSVYSYYRSLIEFRRSHPALVRGSFKVVRYDNQTLLFERRVKGEALGIAINLSPSPASVPCVGEVLFSNSGRRTMDCRLLPYEALILKR